MPSTLRPTFSAQAIQAYYLLLILEMISLWSQTEVLEMGGHYQEILWRERYTGYNIAEQTKMSFAIKSADGWVHFYEQNCNVNHT